MSRAVILAAGFGTRLADGRPIPKPLREVAGVPLIVRVIQALHLGGVKDVAVVIGHLGQMLEEHLTNLSLGPALHFIENDEYDKPNGTSLLKAEPFVTDPTFVLMSDHLWSQALFEAVAAFPLGPEEGLLGVDYRIEECFDLDDATKVQTEGTRIVNIGKTLTEYNALDTGVFRVTPSFMQTLRSCDGPNGCSLSEGVMKVAEQGKMRAADIGDGIWVDVDTPEAHAEAERLLKRHGDALG